MKHIKYININPPVLAIFDRGYLSIEFIDFLEMKKINYLFHLSFNGYKFEQDNILFIDEHVALNSFKTSGDDRRSFASASFFIIFCFKFICILLYLTYSCVINMKKMNELKKAELSSAQTVDKVPGLHRGFSIAVINISMILPVLDTKKFLTYQL